MLYRETGDSGPETCHREQYWLCVSICLHSLSIMCCAKRSKVCAKRKTFLQHIHSKSNWPQPVYTIRISIYAVRLFTLTLFISVDLWAAPYNRRLPQHRTHSTMGYTKDMQIRIADGDAIENVKHTKINRKRGRACETETELFRSDYYLIFAIISVFIRSQITERLFLSLRTYDRAVHSHRLGVWFSIIYSEMNNT